MSRWSRISPTASDRLVSNERHWAVADTAVAAAATAAEAAATATEGEDRGRAPHQRRLRALARFYCSQDGWDDRRPRIIAESREGRPYLRRIYMVQFTMKVNGLADLTRTIRNHRFCYILLK